jgi:hypothetical protein
MRGRRPRARVRVFLGSLGILGLLSLGACGPAKSPRSTVSLRMTGSPKAATVTIDDRFVGSLAVVAARGVALPPGAHRVTVEAAGYFAFDKLVEANEGAGPVRLDVKLVPVPE